MPARPTTLRSRAGLQTGQDVLAFLRLVSNWGARPHGLDASQALIEFARGRLPDVDLRVGEMEELPYEDDTFDLVTGFNSFSFANDIVGALREAGRVAKSDAPVVIQVWGPYEHTHLEAMKEIVRPLMPPRPSDAPPEPDYSKPGALEQLAAQAGLRPESTFDASWAFTYPDEETLARAMVAVAGLAVLVSPDREKAAKEAIANGLARYRTQDGGYRLENEYHYVIARA